MRSTDSWKEVNAVSHVIADEQRSDGGTTAVFSEMGGVREGV